MLELVVDCESQSIESSSPVKNGGPPLKVMSWS